MRQQDIREITSTVARLGPPAGAHAATRVDPLRLTEERLIREDVVERVSEPEVERHGAHCACGCTTTTRGTRNTRRPLRRSAFGPVAAGLVVPTPRTIVPSGATR